MLKAEQFELLKGLQDSNPRIREESIHNLRMSEQANAIKVVDLLDLLQADQPLSWQKYSIEALGRKNDKHSYVALQQCFLHTKNSILLQFLLDTFCEIADSSFLPVVLEKIKQLDSKKIPAADKKNKILLEFTRDQILLGTVKFLRLAADKSAIPLLEELLEHKSSNIRWNALMVFVDRNILLNKKRLITMSKKDPEPMNQEQAKILLKQNFNYE